MGNQLWRALPLRGIFRDLPLPYDQHHIRRFLRWRWLVDDRLVLLPCPDCDIFRLTDRYQHIVLVKFWPVSPKFIRLEVVLELDMGLAHAECSNC